MILRPVVKPIWRPAIRGVLDVGRGSDIPFDLDWSSGALNARISGGAVPSFSRASNTTRINQAGLVETVAPNAAAVDWVQELGGWAARFEEQKTNYCRDSAFQDTLNNGTTGWQSQVSAVYTRNAALAPDGTMTAARLQCIAANSSGVYHQTTDSNAVVVGQFTVSVWAKSAVTGTPQTVRVSQYNTSNGSTWQDFVVGDSWQRCSFTRANSGGTFRQGNITSNSSVPCDVLIWGGQFENNGLSSYIPTAGSTAVRQADSLSVPTTGWWNPVAGTYVAECGAYSGSVTTNARQIVETGTGNNRLLIRIAESVGNNSPVGYISNGTVVTGMGIPASGPPTTAEKLGLIYSTTVPGYFARNGTTQGGLATAVYSGLAQSLLNVGTNLNGYIRRIRYWPAMKSSAELASLTT